jgi:hypothetical protein
MNAIEVTAKFDLQGDASPISFTWQGTDYLVDSIGRRWRDEAGQHILVMVPGGRVFELVFNSSEGRWYLRQTAGSRMVA